MRLAAKIVLAFLLGSVVLLVVDGVLSIRRERRLYEQHAEAEARLLGRAMQTVVASVWRDSGEDEALRLIADVDQQRPLYTLRWIWMDQPLDSPEGPLLTPDEVETLRDGAEVVRRGRRGSQSLLFTYLPIPVGTGRLGALELAESLGPLEAANRATVVRAGLLTLGLAVLAVAIAAPVGLRVVGRPLEALVRKTRRVGQDDYSGPLRVSGRDELTELAVAVNAMCERLSASRERLREETEARIAALEQLRHEDRLRTVGRLASGVAHELGTPLNVVHGRADLITKGRLSEEEVVQAGEIIKSQAAAMTAIVRQLLDFARRQAPKKIPVRPLELVQEVTELLRPMARKRSASLRCRAEGDVGEVNADRGQISQVLTNLVFNGLQALTNGGTVEVSVARCGAEPPPGLEVEPGEYVRFTVADDGEGISSDNRPHLFEPFFTTRDVGSGTGLGLAIVHGIVREHRGWIEVTSEPGSGSQFSVYLPAEQA